MVWGCMSSNGVGKIDFLKWSINAAVYQDVQDHFLIPYIENKFGDNELIFQHDLAPPHTEKSAKSCSGRRGHLFFIEPANSPDANPKKKNNMGESWRGD